MEQSTERARVSYTPVQTRRAFEEVAVQIRAQLMSGALRPGDRLPSERELSEQFGLSRNTVREALRALEMSGLLEFRKGATGGAFVREGRGEAVVSGFTDMFRLGMITPQDMTEARMLVGVEVTRLACKRGTDEEFNALEQNVRESEAAVANGDQQQRIEINLHFHVLLARSAKNPLLAILVDALVEVQSKMLEIITPIQNEKVILSRKRLLKHLRARNEEGAVKEMQAHLSSLQRHYLAQDFTRGRQVAR